MIVQKIEWWSRERFQSRTNTITTGDEKDGHTYIDIEHLPIPDDEIICDHCNSDITVFPCPVVAGFALCKPCQAGMCIEAGDDEYFETMEYNTEMENGKPRVNYGGRKRS